MIFEQMKRLTPTRMYITIATAVFCFFISCGTSHKVTKHEEVPLVTSSLTYIPLTHVDTPRIVSKPDLTKDHTKVNEILVKSRSITGPDSLKELIVKMAWLNMRATDSARNRRMINDSLRQTVNEIRKDQIIANKRAEKYYADAQKTVYYQKSNVAVEWEIHILFAFVIITNLLIYLNKRRPPNLIHQ